MSTTCPSVSMGTTATALACSTISRSATSPSGITTLSTRTFDRLPSWVTVEDTTSYFVMVGSVRQDRDGPRCWPDALGHAPASPDQRGGHERECAQQRHRDATTGCGQPRALV